MVVDFKRWNKYTNRALVNIRTNTIGNHRPHLLHTKAFLAFKKFHDDVGDCLEHMTEANQQRLERLTKLD